MYHRVSKEVDINSREAKSFLKTEETSQENSEQQPISSEPTPSFGSRYHPTPSTLHSLFSLLQCM